MTPNQEQHWQKWFYRIGVADIVWPDRREVRIQYAANFDWPSRSTLLFIVPR